MRRLGLDIGEKRMGVAVSDPSGRVATPLRVLDAGCLRTDPSPLRRLVDDYGVAEIVVGLPLTMSGEEGPQARRVRSTAQDIASALGLPLEFWDERLSSTAAERSMGESGADSRARRGAVDSVAATLVLQAYLDARSTSSEDGEC